MKSSILHKYKIAVAFSAYTATLEMGINGGFERFWRVLKGYGGFLKVLEGFWRVLECFGVF